MQKQQLPFFSGLLLICFLLPETALAASLTNTQLLELRSYALELINESRREDGLSPFEYSTEVERVAQGHATDAAEHFDPTNTETREATYIGHVSSDGRALNARYRDAQAETGWAFGENVGYWTRQPFGELMEASPFGILLMHDGMMAEVPPNDSHKLNILGDYTHIGIGVALLSEEQIGDADAVFIVTNFSRYSSESQERALRALREAPASPRSLQGSLALLHGGPFPDVRPEDPYAEAIEALRDEGIVTGFPDGTFQSKRTISRAELLKMLLDVIGFSPIGREFSACFSDVFNQWFAPYVCVAHRKGWVTGYPDFSFRPEQVVSRAEAVTLAARILDPTLHIDALRPYEDAPEGTWYYLPLQAMASNDLLPFEENIFSPLRGMQRGEVAEILYRSLQKNIVATEE